MKPVIGMKSVSEVPKAVGLLRKAILRASLRTPAGVDISLEIMAPAVATAAEQGRSPLPTP